MSSRLKNPGAAGWKTYGEELQTVSKMLEGKGEMEMTARYYHASEKTLQATAHAPPPLSATSVAGAAGAKLEAVLAGLEELTNEELSTVGSKVREIEAVHKNAHK